MLEHLQSKEYTAVWLKIPFFQDVTLCHWIIGSRRSEEAYYLHTRRCLRNVGNQLPRHSQGRNPKVLCIVVTNSNHMEIVTCHSDICQKHNEIADKMSAPNGGVPSEEAKNFFNSVQLPFPEVVDGKINTLPFLESSKGVVGLVGK